MFIIGNKEKGFKVHFNRDDLLKGRLCCVTIGENIMIELSAEKAYELECRLEEILNPRNVALGAIRAQGEWQTFAGMETEL